MAKGVYFHKPENYPPSRKGKKLTDEQRKRLSKAMKGVNTWMKGRKDSEITRRKKSENSARHWLGKKRPDMYGTNHFAWKGTTPLITQIRNCFDYRQWRSDVYTRDNFTCALCGKRGGDIHADHFPKMFIEIFDEYKIKTLADAVACKEMWNINNGRTLCRQCHYVHGRKNKSTNSKDLTKYDNCVNISGGLGNQTPGTS